MPHELLTVAKVSPVLFLVLARVALTLMVHLVVLLVAATAVVVDQTLIYSHLVVLIDWGSTAITTIKYYIYIYKY